MTVEEIKAAAAAAREEAATPTADDRGASVAQINYINNLLDKRVVDPKFGLSVEEIRARASELSMAKASEWINKLKRLPYAPKEDEEAAGVWTEVPAGRYAIENAEGVLRFYVVDRPDRGRWAGYTFLSVMASDELHPIKDHSAKYVILQQIEADPMAALTRYGREIGVCGVCGRTLTNEDSRAAGIGPVCAGRI